MPQFSHPCMMDLTNNEIKFIMTTNDITSPNLSPYHLVICVTRFYNPLSFINITKTHNFGLIYDLDPVNFRFLCVLVSWSLKARESTFPFLPMTYSNSISCSIFAIFAPPQETQFHILFAIKTKTHIFLVVKYKY